MKNRIWLISLVFVFLSSFYSCENDDDVIENKIISFGVQLSSNSFTAGTVNNGTIKLKTLSWIENPRAMVATFTATGEVRVNGVIQESGVTANDFSKEVVYTVTANGKDPVNYTVILESPQLSGLPVLNINTNNAPILDKVNYVPGMVKIVDYNNESYNAEYPMGVRGRGNSTWTYPKKPYRIKLDSKNSVLGLKEEKSWVLLANYQDPTLMMNNIALELGKRLGLRYTNNYRPVDVFLNGLYQGNYLLTEQVEVAENRVNVDKKTGFLVEMDAYYDEDWKFKSEVYSLPVMLKSPDYSDALDQVIKKAIKDLETAVSSPAFPNTNYKDLIDIQSLIDYLLVNEIVRNNEPKHPKSTYMYKEASGKFYMGPLWDFDWTFGYSGSGFIYFNSPRSLVFKAGMAASDPRPGTMFFCRFFEDPEFCRQYKSRWNQLKETQIRTMLTFIDQQADLLLKSQSYNFSVWPNNLTYTAEIAKMKTWFEQRIAYLDEEINKF